MILKTVHHQILNMESIHNVSLPWIVTFQSKQHCFTLQYRKSVLFGNINVQWMFGSNGDFFGVDFIGYMQFGHPCMLEFRNFINMKHGWRWWWPHWWITRHWKLQLFKMMPMAIWFIVLAIFYITDVRDNFVTLFTDFLVMRKKDLVIMHFMKLFKKKRNNFFYIMTLILNRKLYRYIHKFEWFLKMHFCQFFLLYFVLTFVNLRVNL